MLDNEMEYKQAVIEEREEGIEAIQHSIGEVNEIFQDLAVLIDQQGGQIGAAARIFFRPNHEPMPLRLLLLSNGASALLRTRTW